MKSAYFTGGASPGGVLREIARTQQTKHEKQMRVIDPCLVAAKLDAARNFLLPETENEILADERYREALWFLQWVSSPENYAGGLSRFALDFIQECAEKVGPRCLAERCQRVLKRADLEALLDEVPHVHQLFPDRETERWLAAVTGGLGFGDELSEETLAELRNARIVKLSDLDFSALQTPFIDAARAYLANYFFKVCIDHETHITEGTIIRGTDPAHLGCFKHASRLWYWPGMWDCLFAWIEQRAAKVRAAIAETSVTKEVFRWLDLARKSRRGVMIVGNSRFGKTEAIRCWADMYPSRARIIETPSSSVESELLTAIARALGIRTLSSTKCTEMRAAIDVVLRQSQVMLIFDEFQFMMPSNAGRRSDPPRLNYVRRAIMDLPLATAFICTPQSWKRVEKHYLKATGYTIEQFEGRLLRSAVVLPDDLPREEMIAVARIHFPELSADHLEWIVRHVRAFHGCVLSCIENIARLSRIHAGEAGRTSLRMDDIKQAIAECLPSRQLAAPDAGQEQPAAAPTRDRLVPEADPKLRTRRATNLPHGGQRDTLLRLETASGDRTRPISAPDLGADD